MSKPRIEVIDRAQAAFLAAMTPAERIALANSAHGFACIMIKSRIEQLHPDWPPDRKHREFLRRLLGHGADAYLAAHG